MTQTSHAQLPPVPETILELLPGGTVDSGRAWVEENILDPLDAPPIRWGILGAGGIARTFARDVPAYTRSTISAVAARNIDRARAFAREFDVPLALGSYAKLVTSDEVDAVYVATIHPAHEELALLAIEAGKPVLIEKPFTMNAAQAHRIVDAARDASVFAMEAMWTRHLPHQRIARAVVAAGGLGAPVGVRADHGQLLWHVARLTQKALGGGSLLDLGIYPVSFVQSILGASTRVESAVATLTDQGVDQQMVAVLRGGEGAGALAVATANFDGRSATGAEVVCERGAVELPLQFYRPGEVRVRTFDEGAPPEGAVVGWDATIPGGFQYQAAEVARCLAVGRTESAQIPWADTVHVMELIDDIAARIGLNFDS